MRKYKLDEVQGKRKKKIRKEDRRRKNWELGYEGISWTKSRVRRYKLDEVQKRGEMEE